MSDNSTPSYAAPLVGFRSRKAAQLAAFFALKAAGSIEKLKLIKIIYMTERRFLQDHEHPMLFDELYSLPHGPICSSTLNGIDGIIHEDVWDQFIARNGNEISPVKRFSRDDFDELSDAEIDIANRMWTRFRGMTSSQIRNYSHRNCPEYTEIDRGRIPISYREVLEALGNPAAKEIDREIADLRRAESILAG
ncbi:MAG: Panacea domain-containing protein [Stellaceae bacterium]